MSQDEGLLPEDYLPPEPSRYQLLDLYKRLGERPLAQATDADLLMVLEQRYRTEPVPPCRVCGGPLSIASCGGGNATRYACTGMEDDPDNPGRLRRKEGRGIADDHYERSQWTHYQEGDAEVRELIARYRRALPPAEGPEAGAQLKSRGDTLRHG